MSFTADYITGRQVELAELDAALADLQRRWLVSLHSSPDGEAGWYRRLEDLNQIGVVATAQALLALQGLGSGIPDTPLIIRTLANRARPDGGWAFVSNLDYTSVVDATATVVHALYGFQNAREFRPLNLASVVERGLDWIEEVAHPEGGWGICAGAPRRAYSTALALQALVGCGRSSSQAVLRGAQSLISSADPVTGAWHDAGRRLSVPVSSRTVVSLLTVATSLPQFAGSVDRACDWLESVARGTEFWTTGPECSAHEEVDVQSGERRTRIDYGHSPRTSALTALARAGRAESPNAVAGLRHLIDSLQRNDWGAMSGGRSHLPSSWMLYDTCICLLAFRNAYSSSSSIIWADRSRVVIHPRGRSAAVRTLLQQQRKIAIVIGLLLLLLLLREAGIITDLKFAAVLVVVGSIVLNVLSNFVYDIIKDRPKASSQGVKK